LPTIPMPSDHARLKNNYRASLVSNPKRLALQMWPKPGGQNGYNRSYKELTDDVYP